MYSLRLELLRKPSYQVRRAQLLHELDNSETKQFKIHATLVALAILKGWHAMSWVDWLLQP